MNPMPAANAAPLKPPSAWNLGTTIQVGLREIWSHKFRSLLTMLGIILGVSSLVAMSALVKGMENGAKAALVAIGGLQNFFVLPQDVPVGQRALADEAVGITMNDVHALQAGAPLITAISPEMSVRATVSANGNRYRPRICEGVWPVAVKLNEHVVQYGRMFNAIDSETARSVCVIGTGIRDALWGAPEDTGKDVIPIGKTIYVNGQPFKIIGMFKHYESEAVRKEQELAAKAKAKAEANGKGKNQKGPRWRRRRHHHRVGGWVYWLKNSTLYMPLSTAYIKFRSGMPITSTLSTGSGTASGGAGDPRLSNLELRVDNVDELPQALQQVQNVLMSTHKGIEDFSFRTQEQWADNIKQFVHNARMSGGLIAAIALVVGGIGIMNIMLASITERVREIGIRKSIGATTWDIFVQILAESVVVAILGGFVGLATSFGLVHLIASFSSPDNAPIITLTAMAVAFAFSALVGVLAGLFPAYKASRLNPIQALRYD